MFRKKDTKQEIVHLKTGVKGYAFTFSYYLIIYFSPIDFVIGKWRYSLNACSQNVIYHWPINVSSFLLKDRLMVNY